MSDACDVEQIVFSAYCNKDDTMLNKYLFVVAAAAIALGLFILFVRTRKELGVESDYLAHLGALMRFYLTEATRAEHGGSYKRTLTTLKTTPTYVPALLQNLSE